MATIIKREAHCRATGTPVRAMAFNLTDMSGRADDYVATVRREAAKIVAQAREDAEAVRRQAELEGLQAGQAAVEQLVDQRIAERLSTITPAIAAAAEQIEDARQVWLRQWETSAVKLATAIAGRIVRRELESHPEIAVGWIREALEITAGRAAVTLRLNAADVQGLGQQVEQIVAAVRPAGTATIVPDDAISPGGCRIETEFGAVDAQLETQLERIAAELSPA